MINSKRVEAVSRRIAGECIAVRVRFLNRVITSIYDNALRPLKLTINQLNMLVALSQLGKATAKQVGAVLRMDASTVSRNLERMRNEGWIESTQGVDARSFQLQVSPQGARLMEKALPRWRKAQARASDVLGAANANVLTKVANNLWSASTA
jgi:DNA-binding MarR family transcriptional regulator